MTRIVISNIPENASFPWLIDGIKRMLGDEVIVSQIADPPINEVDE